MTTSTQPRAPAPVEGERDALGELLSLPPRDLATRGDELISLLEHGATASLTPHAGRLLELLEGPHFKRAPSSEMTPREALVRAVMRLGYPWALQLSPDDVGLTRLEEKRQKQQRPRRASRLAMLALAVLGVSAAGGFLVLRDRPVVRHDVVPEAETERVYTLPSLDKVVPASSRAEVLVAAMAELTDADRHDEAFSLGFDCLADPELTPSTCLSGLARVLESKERNIEPRYRVDTTGALFDRRWEVNDRAHPPEGTLRLMHQLRRLWLRPDRTGAASAEALERAASLATAARVPLERGLLTEAVTQGEACVSEFPDALDCHLVLFKAHSALASEARALADKKPHGDAMERHRKELARLVSHEKRLACERGAVPTPRPIGCPDPFR